MEADKIMNILFLCTGNACRSQMAEGWARHLARGAFKVRSAGIEAHGLNPRAVAVMREAGVDISNQVSRIVDQASLDWADLVVTVCGHADEQCPVLPPGVRKLHWPLPDPAKAEGSRAQVMGVFRESRDDICRRVDNLLVEFA
jgi:arsenate reductase (thioredoxin)